MKLISNSQFTIFKLRFFRYWIHAPNAPRMAATQAREPKNHPAPKTVLHDRLPSILGAARVKTAPTNPKDRETPVVRGNGSLIRRNAPESENGEWGTHHRKSRLRRKHWPRASLSCKVGYS